MVGEETKVSLLLSRQVRGQIARSSGRADAVIKGYMCIEKGIQNSGIVGAFHAAPFHHQTNFFLWVHRQHPLISCFPHFISVPFRRFPTILFEDGLQSCLQITVCYFRPSRTSGPKWESRISPALSDCIPLWVGFGGTPPYVSTDLLPIPSK